MPVFQPEMWPRDVFVLKSYFSHNLWIYMGGFTLWARAGNQTGKNHAKIMGKLCIFPKMLSPWMPPGGIQIYFKAVELYPGSSSKRDLAQLVPSETWDWWGLVAAGGVISSSGGPIKNVIIFVKIRPIFGSKSINLKCY